MPARLTADDFFTGFLAALARRGHPTLSLRKDRFDKAVAHAFDHLLSNASKNNLNLRFRIRLHPYHQDSQTLRDAITSAVQRDLISLDNPEYQDLRLKIAPDDADFYLKDLPGGEDLYLSLVDRFLDHYEQSK